MEHTYHPEIHDRGATIPDSGARSWQPLSYFNIFRFILATLFVTLYLTQELPPPLGTLDHALFFDASLAWLIFSLLFQFSITRRQPGFNIQRNFQVVVDIALITLLMHASGGLASGVGMLLVITVANQSMLAMGRGPALFASLATLAILVEEGYTLLVYPAATISFSIAGLLGITLFATAILANILARRVMESEELAKQRSVDLANMAQLTEYIIQQMETGVVVLDARQEVRFLNGAAWKLLGSPGSPFYAGLKELSPELLLAYGRWSRHEIRPAASVKISLDSRQLTAHFTAIGSGGDQGTLIYIDDVRRAHRDAQQLKLASLGRLTASIAHEVRNPLGAISHAGELLAESPHLERGDLRLTEIIKEQSQRINTMVENILRLGRQKESVSQRIDLAALLETLRDNVTQINRVSDGELTLTLSGHPIEIDFDPEQLLQILLNLVQNGLRHARDADPPRPGPLVEIVSGMQHDITYIDIIDSGPGVPLEHQSQLFEPFFTTENSGTGLGLYISRELASNGGAQLDYLPMDDGKSRFRLTFEPVDM